jgi:hypothetical protein
MAQGAKLPVETIARRLRFVAEAQPAVSGGKLVGQFAHRIRPVGDLAPIADLAFPVVIGQTNGNLALANIQTNVNCCIILQGSSPMSEALSGLPANQRSDILRDGPPASFTRRQAISEFGSPRRRRTFFRWGVVTHQEF